MVVVPLSFFLNGFKLMSGYNYRYRQFRYFGDFHFSTTHHSKTECLLAEKSCKRVSCTCCQRSAARLAQANCYWTQSRWVDSWRASAPLESVEILRPWGCRCRRSRKLWSENFDSAPRCGDNANAVDIAVVVFYTPHATTTVIDVAFVARLVVVVATTRVNVVSPTQVSVLVSTLAPTPVPAPVPMLMLAIAMPRNVAALHGNTRQILHCQYKLYTPLSAAGVTQAYSARPVSFHPHPPPNRY